MDVTVCVESSGPSINTGDIKGSFEATVNTGIGQYTQNLTEPNQVHLNPNAYFSGSTTFKNMKVPYYSSCLSVNVFGNWIVSNSSGSFGIGFPGIGHFVPRIYDHDYKNVHFR